MAIAVHLPKWKKLLTEIAGQNGGSCSLGFVAAGDCEPAIFPSGKKGHREPAGSPKASRAGRLAPDRGNGAQNAAKWADLVTIFDDFSENGGG
jgi:hypothetical protein